MKHFLKASLMCAAIILPVLAGAYTLGAQAASPKKVRVEAEGFRWAGVSAPPTVAKVAHLPTSTCALYRVDTEGTRLYVLVGEDRSSASEYTTLNCQIIGASIPPVG